MKTDWPTQKQDMDIAESVIEAYAEKIDSTGLGLVELFFDPKEKKMGFGIARWVIKLAHTFYDRYGAVQGDFVTRQIVTQCIIGKDQIH